MNPNSGAAGRATGDEESDSEEDGELTPFDEQQEMASMYRMILKEEPNEDARKTHYQIMREVYDHTENKQDVGRNMLATIFVRDPKKYKEGMEEVQKIMKNNVAWPQGYIPDDYPIKRPPVKYSKEEIALAKLKEKHSLRMAPLNKFFIDEAIQNLKQVCGTSNAHTTYKTSGWKASFSKYKNQSVKEQIIKDQKLRDRMEKQLPKKLRQ